MLAQLTDRETHRIETTPLPLSRLRRRPEIKLRQLRYFLAVAEHLHFSKAAEAQHVTQSTLSHQIAELEAQIGRPLFDRSSKSIRTTAAGETFKLYAMRVIHEVDAGCTALQELDHLVDDSLRLGVPQSFAHRRLGPVLGQFMTQHPGIRLHIEELTPTQIDCQLASGQLDLGISYTTDRKFDINAEPLGTEHLVLITGVGHRLGAQASVRMDALAHEPLALLSGDHASRPEIDDGFRAAGIAPRMACETDNLALILDLVRHSNLAAIVPSEIAQDAVGLRTVTLTDPTPIRSIALLRPSHRRESEAARSLAVSLRAGFNVTSARAGSAPRLIKVPCPDWMPSFDAEHLG